MKMTFLLSRLKYGHIDSEDGSKRFYGSAYSLGAFQNKQGQYCDVGLTLDKVSIASAQVATDLHRLLAQNADKIPVPVEVEFRLVTKDGDKSTIEITGLAK